MRSRQSASNRGDAAAGEGREGAWRNQQHYYTIIVIYDVLYYTTLYTLPYYTIYYTILYYTVL